MQESTQILSVQLSLWPQNEHIHLLSPYLGQTTIFPVPPEASHGLFLPTRDNSYFESNIIMFVFELYINEMSVVFDFFFTYFTQYLWDSSMFFTCIICLFILIAVYFIWKSIP